MAADNQRTILMLEIESNISTEKKFDDLALLLTNYAYVQHMTSVETAMQHLNMAIPSVIILTNSEFAMERYPQIVKGLATYVQNGGTLICMGVFDYNSESCMTFFSQFGLQWGIVDQIPLARPPSVSPLDRGRGARSVSVTSNASNSSASSLEYRMIWVNRNASDIGLEDRLVPTYRVKTALLAGVADSSSVYHTGHGETAVAWQGVGRGWLGYIGDAKFEYGSKLVIMKMCGLF